MQRRSDEPEDQDLFPRAAFYSYAYPEPPGFKDCRVPEPAHYETPLGEFILLYDDIRQSRDPDGLLMDFLTSTYTAEKIRMTPWMIG